MKFEHAISTAALALILVGLLQLLWRRRGAHVACMLVAFALDLGLVLHIELSRGAMGQVVRPMRPLLAFHVAISTAALLLYPVQMVLGWKLWRGQPASRGWHRWCGVAFLMLRLGNYITSFLVAKP